MGKKVFKRIFITILASVQIIAFPYAGYALEGEGGTAPSSQSPSPSDQTQGPTSPPGPEASAYHFNEITGLWENDHYTWDPVTKQTAPKNAPNYSYNPETGRWDTTEWRYDAPSSAYVPNTVSTTTLPENAQVTATDALPSNPEGAASLSSDSSLPNTTVHSTSNSAGAFNLFYNASISNNVNSSARSGDATLSSNTLAGNAVTGDALTMATVLNLLQSVWDPTNGDIATFTANIDGDVTGDLTIDPGQIPQNVSVNEENRAELDVNVTQNTVLDNNINLDAQSGNALASRNTQAGNVETGTATAVANVVNMLNSMISAGQSFVGTVNINGNLNGDILLPEDMINQLLASNVPRATLDITKIANSEILADFSDNTNITNNINATAESGAASASRNTEVGNVRSGDASTNITVLNLTGRQIVGSNALLVFVNVLGEWVGMIMDAPAGTTAAAVGGDISYDQLLELNADMNIESNTTINNNINLNAQSGDALAEYNTQVGNIQTGDATALANVANISRSNLSLSGWFGVLFLNVFGTWHGSFGVNTDAGTVATKPAASSSNTQSGDSEVQVFRFTPSEETGTTNITPVTTEAVQEAFDAASQELLGAATTVNPPESGSSLFERGNPGHLVALLSLGSLIFLGSESILSAKKRQELRKKFVEPFSRRS